MTGLDDEHEITLLGGTLLRSGTKKAALADRLSLRSSFKVR